MLRLIQTLLRKLSLQTAITLPLSLQITLAIGSIAYLSYRNGQLAVYSLAFQLKDEITSRILHELNSSLSQPHIINQLNANSLTNGNLNLLTGEGETQLWQQVQSFPSMNLVYCATEADGAFLGAGRSGGGSGSEYRIYVANEGNGRISTMYAVDSLGRRGEQVSQVAERVYDPRSRPWYQAATAAGTATWSEIYLDFETWLPTITAALPIYETENLELLGVCAVDFIVSKEISEFLSELFISENGIAFVVNEQGYLIGSSTEDRVIQGRGENTSLIPAIASENPLIRYTTDFLVKTYGSLGQKTEIQGKFYFNNQDFFLQTAWFTDELGLSWMLVLVAPEKDFMEEINDNNVLTLFLSVTALAITIISGWAITRWVTQPLRELSDRAQALSEGNWDSPIELDRSDAIGDLSRAFAKMAQQLREVFFTLEQRVEERSLALIELNQELQRLATLDGLTQLANRRQFDDYLQLQWEAFQHQGKALALVLCDVDYFKPYNDTYGHPAGDRCLQALAHLFREALPPSQGLVARYGGEEFAFILPGVQGEALISLLDTLRRGVANLGIPHQGSPYGVVTISLGAAIAQPYGTPSPQQMLNQADQALYQAKFQGRNRHYVAS